jgi:hypothetical protein
VGVPEELATRLRALSEECAEIGSPFYARLCELMAEDAEEGGPTLDVLGPTLAEPFDDYHAIRLLDGIHWIVLEGDAPELAPHYRSLGGDNDADAAWPHLRALLADPPEHAIEALGHPPQTNEPARSAALIVGLLEVAARTGLPLRLMELGSSAGLNLHVDRYRFEAGGRGVGPEDSGVRFVDHWLNGTPRVDAPFEIAGRAGCDLYPVDLRQPSERTRLLSYVWPDEGSRFALNRAAVEIASADPVVIERAPVDDWLDAQLEGGLTDGVATVVFHSLVWLYLPGETRARIRDRLEQVGRAAPGRSPLAWLRYEQESDHRGACDLRLTLWPSGGDELLATGSHHDTPVTLFGG